MAMTIVETTRPVTGGVDTHADVHVAAAVEGNGGVLGVESFPTTPAGYAQLHGWLAAFDLVERVGVEGTGAYGAGLARNLPGQTRLTTPSASSSAQGIEQHARRTDKRGKRQPAQ